MADPERSAYFLKSALDLNFICLRNDVFLSNLDACDAEELARCIKDDDSHALDAIVRKTWRKAIEARIDGVEGIFDLTYYPDGTSAPNNSVVFEVAAQVLDYDDSGALITSGEEARCREAAISSVLESHIEEYSALLGAPVVFFFDC